MHDSGQARPKNVQNNKSKRDIGQRTVQIANDARSALSAPPGEAF